MQYTTRTYCHKFLEPGKTFREQDQQIIANVVTLPKHSQSNARTSHKRERAQAHQSRASRNTSQRGDRLGKAPKVTVPTTAEAARAPTQSSSSRSKSRGDSKRTEHPTTANLDDAAWDSGDEAQPTRPTLSECNVALVRHRPVKSIVRWRSLPVSESVQTRTSNWKPTSLKTPETYKDMPASMNTIRYEGPLTDEAYENGWLLTLNARTSGSASITSSVQHSSALSSRHESALCDSGLRELCSNLTSAPMTTTPSGTRELCSSRKPYHEIADRFLHASDSTVDSEAIKPFNYNSFIRYVFIPHAAVLLIAGDRNISESDADRKGVSAEDDPDTHPAEVVTAVSAIHSTLPGARDGDGGADAVVSPKPVTEHRIVSEKAAGKAVARTQHEEPEIRTPNLAATEPRVTRSRGTRRITENDFPPPLPPKPRAAKRKRASKPDTTTSSLPKSAMDSPDSDSEPLAAKTKRVKINREDSNVHVAPAPSVSAAGSQKAPK
ncbi:uncharacterized protein B0H18DRAFT_961845 [Fomitopsis serialis]|uniref:uncharacterized protein n=1 Tax=Fomitopsis serialis TaxID=139415 RepID=UPI0020074FB8|nr:uncharacterized protein B0H18DRAFT_961845 [Neoantrodia serialis]KAH9911720.1 hypothetical protein B0H18DRAFT_961845 [Neoantrodia serialis]